MRTIAGLFFALLPATMFAQARVAVPAGMPVGTRSIWVLSADNKLSQYDASIFRLAMSTPVAPESRTHPERLQISSTGEILYEHEPSPQTGIREYSFLGMRQGAPFVAGAYARQPAKTGGFLNTVGKTEVHFSRDGQRLFWFENHHQVLEGSEGEVWRDGSFRAWTTDLQGGHVQQITEFKFPRCSCETAVCSESCPEALVWSVPAGISDFFFVTKWVEGQTQPDFQETSLYQQKSDTWTPLKLPQPEEGILDAAEHGQIFIAQIFDGGCCGWVNESDDTTSIVSGGQAESIFDERNRFHNDNYDVSFSTSNAFLSPNTARVAYTISSTNKPGDEIRLGDDGKDNPQELERVKKAIADMPVAEVVSVVAKRGVLQSIAHAEVAGWLDDARVLIVTAGEIKILDVAAGKLNGTGIKADAAKYVFLR